ncbi:MAG: peptide-methionine (S)-S-oxide reductase MsrA [Nitriliruptor sp.]|nr:MAG: peptide-methionine (S)-S-oxide reductase MsrA [Nitriliruptor sp.]
MFGRSKLQALRPEEALPGRAEAIAVQQPHHVHGRSLTPPWPDGHELLVVGMGCFWGAERIFWQLEGVWTTFVGYAGGITPNPTYREVCTARTGHAEIAGVVYDPSVTSLETLFAAFWENHDPTQADRQGNDIGPQYRSILLTTADEQAAAAALSRDRYQARLAEAGFSGPITTTIEPLGALYWAEPEHQQYLSKHPWGYCNHGFCQVTY